jgi:hypothetical protein
MQSPAAPRSTRFWQRWLNAWASPVLGGIVLFYLMVVATHAAFRPRGAACTSDADCPVRTFCDRDACVASHALGLTSPSFGAACEQSLECDGGYLCVDGRCRSCASDDECRDELGAPACTMNVLTQGSHCGRN